MIWTAAFALLLLQAGPEQRLRSALGTATGVVDLPAGEFTLHAPLELVAGAHDLTVRGPRTRLKVAADFKGRAAFVVKGGRGVKVSGMVVEGGGFAFDGVADFEITDCEVRTAPGNGIVVAHSNGGRIAGNKIGVVTGRAIEIGQSTRITVEKNTGVRVGYPVDGVRETPALIGTVGDVGRSTFRDNRFEEVNGVCLDLQGLHDSEVRGNSCVNREAREVYPNGGFGIVVNARNVLVWGNRIEGFVFGGVLVSGSGHRIANNHFVKVNVAHCNENAVRNRCLAVPDEPNYLRSGIYLRHGGQATRDNEIEGNEVQGYGMAAHCVEAGPGVSAAQNRIGRNDCSDDAPVNALLRGKHDTRNGVDEFADGSLLEAGK